MLQPAIRQQLHTNADAEEGRPVAQHAPLQRIDHAWQTGEPFVTRTERAHARQHDPLRPRQRVRVRNQCNIRADTLERIGDRMQIACSVIDQGDLLFQRNSVRAESGFGEAQPPSIPLVLGTAPPLRGSISTAARIARAKPL